MLLGVEATPALAEELKVDAVIAALGGEAVIPPIPGIDGKNVVLAIGIHEHMDQVGEQVVIVGGGLVGCEESIDLAERGKRVTVVEMKPELCRDAPYLHHEGVLLEMEKNQVKTIVNATCKEITAEGVVLSRDGRDEFVRADTVVIAAGVKPRMAEAEALRGSALDFRRIGDCKRTGKVHEALRDGFDAAAFLC